MSKCNITDGMRKTTSRTEEACMKQRITCGSVNYRASFSYVLYVVICVRDTGKCKKYSESIEFGAPM